LPRPKKSEKEKFIPYSITLPPELDRAINARDGGEGRSSVVRGDLESYYGLLAAGRNLARKCFTRREVLAVINVLEGHPRLLGDPGQLVRWLLGDLATDIEEENQWNRIERHMGVSGEELVGKLRQASQLELLALHDCTREYLQHYGEAGAIELLGLFDSPSTSSGGFTTRNYLDAQAEHGLRGGYLLNLGTTTEIIIGKQGQAAGERGMGHSLYTVVDLEEALDLGRTEKKLQALAPTYQEKA